MKLIIDIDETEYSMMKTFANHGLGSKAIDIILSGIPLDKIREEIEQKIEQERFARSVFRDEEKDTVKVEQCTGSIFAYNNVIRLIDKYKAESEGKK